MLAIKQGIPYEDPRRVAEALGAELCAAPGSALSRLIQCLDRMIEAGPTAFRVFATFAIRIARMARDEQPEDELLAIALNKLSARIPGTAPAHAKRLQENRDELLTLLLRAKEATAREVGATAAEQETPPASAAPPAEPWRDRALALIADRGRDWPVARLAKEVGVSRSTLYRDRRIAIALHARRAPGKSIQRARDL